jgi:hypothetical protein
MESSERKKAANQENGKRGKGPKNTRHTRHNATKHALTAQGITDLDVAEGYQTVLNDFMKTWKPSDELTRFLAESLALDIVRARRARRLEAEFIMGLLHPRKYQPNPSAVDNFEGLGITEPTLIDPGLPPSIDVQHVSKLVNVYARYEQMFFKRISQILREYERLNRIGEGEHVPSSGATNASVCLDSGVLASAATQSENKKIARNEGEREETAENISQPVSSSAELSNLLPAEGHSTAADSQSGRKTPSQAPWSPGPSPGPLWQKS